MALRVRGEALAALRRGQAIPAHPLALTPERRLDERRQRALTRYYLAAGAGGIAVGVHTTQFEVRDPRHALLRPVLALAAEVAKVEAPSAVRIAGICGGTPQAVDEARLARDLGYDVGLVSLAGLPSASDDDLVAHCRTVGEVLPIMGFYLQPAVGGRFLSRGFWRSLCELEGLVAIKVAPFSRYLTLDVVRAVAESGRADEIPLYTGNDDHIVHDLVTPFRVPVGKGSVTLRFVGGLLGQWAVWTRRAVETFDRARAVAERGGAVPAELLSLGEEITEANRAIFDADHAFAGCIAGIQEVLTRSGFLTGRWTLDRRADLSPGQREEIDRIYALYPHLRDDAFVAEHVDEWMAS